MSLGTILLSLAVVLGVGAYVAWPFRRTGIAMTADADVERLIAAWVKRAQAAQAAVAEDDGGKLPGEIAPRSGPAEEPSPAVAAAASDDDAVVNFCPYCGRRVEQDHVFCPKCGRQLAKEARR